MVAPLRAFIEQTVALPMKCTIPAGSSCTSQIAMNARLLHSVPTYSGLKCDHLSRGDGWTLLLSALDCQALPLQPCFGSWVPTFWVIEAEAQIGGRIQVLLDPDNSQYLADLGPTWVWPKYQPVVDKVTKSLGLETYEQFNDGDAVILGYGPVPLRQPLPGQEGMVRIVAGPSAFIETLSKGIDAASIRTSTPVIGVREDGSERVSVFLASGEIVTAERVLISIPLRVAAANLEMPWAPQALLDAMRRTPTWMSTHAKAIALYDRPFWRDARLAGRIASRTGPLVEAHDHSGANGSPAAIFGFVGWPPEIRQQDPERLRRAILNQLAECFGPSAADPIDLVVQDWATNRNIVTDIDLSVTADPPGSRTRYSETGASRRSCPICCVRGIGGQPGTYRGRPCGGGAGRKRSPGLRQGVIERSS